jgi:hypothetical protein
VRTAKSGDKDAGAMKALLEDKLLPHLNEAKPVRGLALSDDEKALREVPVPADEQADPVHLPTSTKTASRTTPHVDAVREHRRGGERRGGGDLQQARVGDHRTRGRRAREFLADLGMEEPGLNRVIRAGYELLTCTPTSPPAPRKCAPGP